MAVVAAKGAAAAVLGSHRWYQGAQVLGGGGFADKDDHAESELFHHLLGGHTLVIGPRAGANVRLEPFAGDARSVAVYHVPLERL